MSAKTLPPMGDVSLKRAAIVTFQNIMVANVDYLINAQVTLVAASKQLESEEALLGAAITREEDSRKRVRKAPEFYIRNRSLHNYKTVFLTYNDEEYRNITRFSKTNFNILVSLLREELINHTPIPFSFIPNRAMRPNHVVAIALHHLSSGNNSGGVAELFGVSRQCVGRCTFKFCKAVLKVLSPIYLSWPTIYERESIKSGFEAIQGFKNCVGAIDCTHVYMKSPCKKRSGDYRDRNNQFSTVMQAVVDHRMKFLNVATGFPGSIHDLRVLSLSSLWHNRKSYFNGPEIILPGSGIEIVYCWRWRLRHL